MKSLITLSIAVTNIEEAQVLIKSLTNIPDVIEFRLDYLSALNFSSIQQLIDNINIPCILTLRSKLDGGQYQRSEHQRLQDIKQLAALEPNYLDIEHTVSNAVIDEIKLISNKTKLIKSYHNFKNTPDNLINLLEKMKHSAISIYKIITTAHTSLDTLKMLSFIKTIHQQTQIIGHCMGEPGTFGRIAGAVLGNYFTYTFANQMAPIAPGMLSLNDAINIFFLKKKNKKTRLYALLGAPVSHSIGHIFHNQFFNQNKLNALYLKINLDHHQLTSFFQQIITLPFSGFSVTMPLKQHVPPFINTTLEPQLNAFNTLLIKNKKLYATNTDGLGVIQSLETVISLEHKEILLLGAGGTAQAITHALQKKSVYLSIANRNIEKSENLAKLYHAKTISLYSEANHFDIIINTLPECAFKEKAFKIWLSGFLKNQPVLFNAPYNQDTETMKELAEDYFCQYISGKLMFYFQAKAQQKLWFNSEHYIS